MSPRDNLLRPLHRALLPKIGVNRNFPTSMIPVSPAIGGLGLRSLELEQGLEQLSLLTGLWTADTPSKSLLTTSLELLQLEAGSSKFILHLPFHTYAHLTTKCWFTSLWEFCSTHDILPHLPNFTLPTATAPGDQSIIDSAIQSRSFSSMQLQQINLVRVQFQVYFLSDLVRPNSTRVLDCYMNGKEDPWTCSSFAWPRVVPSPAAHVVWKRFMSVITSGDQFLLCNLSHQRCQSHHRTTRCSINSSRTLLRSLGSNEPTYFKLNPATRGDFHPVPTSSTNDPTNESIWVESCGTRIRLHSPIFSLPEISAAPSLDAWIRDNVTWHKTSETVKAAIVSCSSTFVVDGSFYPDKSHLVSAHWRCSKDEILLTEGNFVSTVECQHRNAYTAELCGCLAVIQFVEWILAGSTSHSPISISIGTDCSAVINRISSTQLVTSFTTYLHQIVREIRLKVKKLNLRLIPIKISAHQDDILEWSALSFLEKENVACDSKAKQIVQLETRSSVPFPFDLHTPCLSTSSVLSHCC